MKQSKFDERRRISEFNREEARAALSFLAHSSLLARQGKSVFGDVLYAASEQKRLPVDLVDAALRFLARYGFVVETRKLQWVVRKPFGAADVDEACELLPIAYAPLLDNETPFDALRRLRTRHVAQSTSSP